MTCISVDDPPSNCLYCRWTKCPSSFYRGSISLDIHAQGCRHEVGWKIKCVVFGLHDFSRNRNYAWLYNPVCTQFLQHRLTLKHSPQKESCTFTAWWVFISTRATTSGNIAHVQKSTNQKTKRQKTKQKQKQTNKNLTNRNIYSP